MTRKPDQWLHGTTPEVVEVREKLIAFCQRENFRAPVVYVAMQVICDAMTSQLFQIERHNEKTAPPEVVARVKLESTVQ